MKVSGENSADSVLEEIGKDVLCSFERGQIPSLSNKMREDPTRSLIKFLSTPKEELKNDWEEEFKEILDNLTQIDYAIYGKQISYFLLNARTKTEDSHRSKNNRKHSSSKQIKPPKFNASDFGQKEIKLSKRKFPEWLPTI